MTKDNAKSAVTEAMDEDCIASTENTHKEFLSSLIHNYYVIYSCKFLVPHGWRHNHTQSWGDQ